MPKPFSQCLLLVVALTSLPGCGLLGFGGSDGGAGNADLVTGGAPPFSLVETLKLPGRPVVDLACTATHLYVAHAAGVDIFDLAAPLAHGPAGALDATVNLLRVRGSRLYGGPAAWDLADPLHPRRVPGTNAVDPPVDQVMAVDDRFVYVGTATNGAERVPVPAGSDPGMGAKVSFNANGEVVALGLTTHALAINSNVAQTLFFYDITQTGPGLSVATAKFFPPYPGPSQMTFLPWALLGDGPLLYAFGGGILQIFDTTDPKNPLPLNQSPTGTLGPQNKHEIAKSGKWLATPGTSGPAFWDVSDPAHPILLPYKGAVTPTGIASMTFCGGSLFVGDQAMIQRFAPL